MREYEGKVVLISGAAGNLGQALAAALSLRGAALALLDRQRGRLEPRYPDPHRVFSGVDLTIASAVQQAVEAVFDHFGALDVLINAAGGFRQGAPLYETAPEDLDFMLSLNLKTAFHTSRAVLPRMLKQRSGSIINIGARPGMRGVPGASAYSAAKGALLRLTETMAAELHGSGVRVNAVIPGTMDTPQNRSQLPDESDWVKPEEVAEAIVFLASAAASGIHGALLPVYGAGRRA